MQATVLEQVGQPLLWRGLPTPEPCETQSLIRVRACGGCRTDLYVFDGELPHPKLPRILWHEIVGEVVQRGVSIEELQPSHPAEKPESLLTRILLIASKEGDWVLDRLWGQVQQGASQSGSREASSK